MCFWHPVLKTVEYAFNVCSTKCFSLCDSVTVSAGSQVFRNKNCVYVVYNVGFRTTNEDFDRMFWKCNKENNGMF